MPWVQNKLAWEERAVLYRIRVRGNCSECHLSLEFSLDDEVDLLVGYCNECDTQSMMAVMKGE